MDDGERRQLAAIERFIPDLRSLVGPTCTELLRSGRKIEVEALCTLTRVFTLPTSEWLV